LNLIGDFPIQDKARIATVLLKEQLAVKMSEGCKKHDVYHYDISLLSPSWNRSRGGKKKNGQVRVNRLENEADYSLPFTANIRKAWEPTYIHAPL